MAKVLKSLGERGLTRGYQITDDGKASVGRFADEVLGSPREFESEIRKCTEYASLMGKSELLIDEFLRKRFTAVKTTHRKKGTPAMTLDAEGLEQDAN